MSARFHFRALLMLALPLILSTLMLSKHAVGQATTTLPPGSRTPPPQKKDPIVAPKPKRPPDPCSPRNYSVQGSSTTNTGNPKTSLPKHKKNNEKPSSTKNKKKKGGK